MPSTNPRHLLVQRAQSGDREAFNELVEGCRGRLEAFVVSRLGTRLRSRVEVDDVVQESVLRAFLGIGRFEWRGDGSFLRWISAIAEYVIRDLGRARKIRVEPLESGIASEDPTPSKGVRREERFDRLLEAYEQLSPDHRDVIRMARLERLKVTEIAARLNRTPSAVRHLLLRALKSLRKSFGRETESLRLPPRSLAEREGDDVE